MGLCTIKRSSEFQRVRGGLRAANASFVIETRARTPVGIAAVGIAAAKVERDDKHFSAADNATLAKSAPVAESGPVADVSHATVSQAPGDGRNAKTGSATIETACCPRFGFTVTRKMGNAVVRNRIRRRFKEALRLLEPGIIAPGHDYVVIARPGVIEMPFAELKQMLATTIAGLHRPRSADAGGDRKRYSGKPNSGKPNSGKPNSGQPKFSKPKPGQPALATHKPEPHRPQQRQPSKPSAGTSKPDR